MDLPFYLEDYSDIMRTICAPVITRDKNSLKLMNFS